MHSSGNLLVTNIGRLLTMVPADSGDGPLGALWGVGGAAIYIENGVVARVGVGAGIGEGVAPGTVVVDAGGRLVTPGLVEPHAHPIFAGSRAAEFDLRSQGRSYLEIQQAGGGILSTVRATRAASDEELVSLTRGRLERLLSFGVTVCEAKSGYALEVEGELRLLRLLASVGRTHAIDLSPTLLAHVPPPEASSGEARASWIRRFVGEAIPTAKAEGLAEAVDVFCDRGAFTVEETREILAAAARHGLALRVHAEQLSHTGAADLAASMGARSVEHLEFLADASIPGLARAGTVCTLLPGAALTLRLPFPDARKMLDGGCTVALGTDLNPGSSLSENLPLMMSLACMQMGMSCAEAFVGVTAAAARAVGRPACGHLGVGARGDLVIWNAGDERDVVQHYGVSLVDEVYVRGRRAGAGADYQGTPK